MRLDDGRPKQVQDDFGLLRLMMSELRAAPDLYRPGNYWQVYERFLLPELEGWGLRDFRRRRHTLLMTLGATDYLPASAAIATRPDRPRLSPKALLLRCALAIPPLRRRLYSLSAIVLGLDLSSVRRLWYAYARAYGDAVGAQPIDRMSTSTVGNPEDAFAVGGNVYTRAMIRCYLDYAYCCRFMDFGSIGSVMEIGSGLGRQIEVLRKLNPHLCFYLFDIPPQLYVCERYLSAVFESAVVGYRETRELPRLPEPEPGRIFVFPTWKLPQLENLRWDLHWNCASYQEMGPSRR